eukprot:gene4121-5157_t
MEDLNRLYQIRKTVIQMLGDRGYLVGQADSDLTKEGFKAKYNAEGSRKALMIFLVKKDDPADLIYVFFPDDPKVGVKPIREYVTQMKDKQVNRAIIVVQQNITPFAKQALAEFSQAKKIILEQFSEAELLVNITHHTLVPKHILLTKEEKLELLSRYKMKETQLPRIQINDPIARYYGLQRGNVVKIIRPSETAGRYVTYSWRIENGLTPDTSSTQDAGTADIETPAVENPEECVLWYYNYFLGKGHQNYLGLDDSGEIFGASIIKEETEYGDYSYKAIVWTPIGIERQWFTVKQKQTLTPTEIIKKAVPRISVKKIKEIESPNLLQDLKDLEATQTEFSYKFGILLARPGQSTEDEFYNNSNGSRKWNEFLEGIGEEVELRSFKGFRGGLDVVNNTTGTHSLYTNHKGYEIMFHVSTLLPHTPGDSQQIERKRHIGNDIVIIIFYDCDSDEEFIPWDPSMVKSNFNHIFAIIRPEGPNYHLEFVVKNSIAKFGPKLPNPSIFPKGESFKQFLMTKLVNAQRAALQSAPSFTIKLKRTFKAQLENIYQKYSNSNPTLTVTSLVTKRRSSSISNINKGKELKAKEMWRYGSGSIPRDSPVFDTEIIFSKSFNEKINCLDVIDSDDLKCILTVATDEAIYILKTDLSIPIITTDCLFEKILQIKDVTRLTVIKPLNVLLVLNSKGLISIDLEPILTTFTSKNHSGIKMLDESKCKKIQGSKGCTVYGFTKGDAATIEKDITLLYVAIKKTIILYEWNKGEFQKAREQTIYENIKTICPIAPGMICVGVAKEFLLVDIFTQTIKELYKKHDSEPVKALSLDNEILLCFNNIGFFVDEKGTKTRGFEFKWGSIPSSLVLLPSYALGISGNLIEVRSLLNGFIIQSISTESDLTSGHNNLELLSSSPTTLNHNLLLNNHNSSVGGLNHSNNGIPPSHNNNSLHASNGSNGSNSNGGSANNILEILNNAGGVHTFSTFNDIAHIDNGNIFVASSFKGSSCIIRIRQAQTNAVFSPPTSPLINIPIPASKEIKNLTPIDQQHLNNSK